MLGFNVGDAMQRSKDFAFKCKIPVCCKKRNRPRNRNDAHAPVVGGAGLFIFPCDHVGQRNLCAARRGYKILLAWDADAVEDRQHVGSFHSCTASSQRFTNSLFQRSSSGAMCG